jgi:hypothetical protein
MYSLPLRLTPATGVKIKPISRAAGMFFVARFHFVQTAFRQPVFEVASIKPSDLDLRGAGLVSRLRYDVVQNPARLECATGNKPELRGSDANQASGPIQPKKT